MKRPACKDPSFNHNHADKCLSRFSDVFFVDATTEETIKTDLEAITPAGIEPSTEASRIWLATQDKGNWLLVFNNADDTNLNLGRFFPSSRSGNILITTRNQELLALCTCSAKVAEMEHEDASKLLLKLSKVDETEENKVLAGLIVQVFHFGFDIYNSSDRNTYRTYMGSHWLYLMLVPILATVRH